jgi:hypothetical protein
LSLCAFGLAHFIASVNTCVKICHAYAISSHRRSKHAKSRVKFPRSSFAPPGHSTTLLHTSQPHRTLNHRLDLYRVQEQPNRKRRYHFTNKSVSCISSVIFLTLLFCFSSLSLLGASQLLKVVSASLIVHNTPPTSRATAYPGLVSFHCRR